MNRVRLEAEAIRDSLLAVAGKLDATRGGPGFTDLAGPRRTLYLMSVRTGASTSDFGRLFDSADPGSIVAQRGQSVVAPQALFFLNDPLLSDLARDLAARLAREPPAQATRPAFVGCTPLPWAGRPRRRNSTSAHNCWRRPANVDPWERYCHLILCTNEFVYLD